LKNRIKLFDPFVGQQEKKSLLNVLRSGFWASGSGEGKVLEFEKRFRRFIGSKECIAVNSGTAALHLALSCLDISRKEVILPSLSFVSTAHAVLYNNAKPIFVDIDPQTLCLDPVQVDKKITSKTKVILPVHFGGCPADISKLQKIAKRYNTFLVEDAAHACGTQYHRKKIGCHGDFVCFSFHPIKNLSMPTGGLIAINSPHFKNFRKILLEKRWCGITNRKNGIYDIKNLGWNFYMNEFSAAIGIEQLNKLEKMNIKRKKIAKRYSSGINLEYKMPFNTNCAYHLYWILVKKRTNFRKKMNDVGIETGIHYKPIHQMSMYCNRIKLPITEEVGKSIVSIPMHPKLTNEDIDKIIKSINKFA